VRRPARDDKLLVLYIEDNPASIAVVEDALAAIPWVRTRIAREAMRGIDVARTLQPAVILLDLHLPDLSGEVVLERLRAAPETAAIPIVVLSGDATDQQRRELIEAGAAAYLTKPIAVEDLRGAVEQYAGSPP
jgi:CheY-like chemotaxis protein